VHNLSAVITSRLYSQHDVNALGKPSPIAGDNVVGSHNHPVLPIGSAGLTGRDPSAVQ